MFRQLRNDFYLQLISNEIIAFTFDKNLNLYISQTQIIKRRDRERVRKFFVAD